MAPLLNPSLNLISKNPAGYYTSVTMFSSSFAKVIHSAAREKVQFEGWYTVCLDRLLGLCFHFEFQGTSVTCFHFLAI